MRKVLFAATLFIISSFFSSPLSIGAIEGATLSLSPANGNYTLTKSFNVNILVASPSQSLNAVSATLAYPADKLEVASLSESGSIIKVWTEDPSFANGAGTIKFEGLVLNPGYQGDAGKVLTITFKVKSAGKAKVQFTSASVLANDGAGTNIVTGSFGAEYNLQNDTGVTPPPPINSNPPISNTSTSSKPKPVANLGEIILTRLPDNQPENPQPIFKITATNPQAIVSYQMRIGAGEWFNPDSLKIAPDTYRLPVQAPGAHIVTMRGIGSGDNYAEAISQAVVLPIPTTKIVAYTAAIAPPQKPLTVEGEDSPGNLIILTLISGDKTVKTQAQTDETGKWTAQIADELPQTDYALTATSERPDGATSLPSEPLPIKVTSWSQEAIQIVLRYTLAGIAIVALMAILFASTIITRARMIRMKHKLGAEAEVMQERLNRDKARLAEDLNSPTPVDKKIIERDMADLTADTQNEVERLKDLS